LHDKAPQDHAAAASADAAAATPTGPTRRSAFPREWIALLFAIVSFVVAQFGFTTA
jgi:hypothetical protein